MVKPGLFARMCVLAVVGGDCAGVGGGYAQGSDARPCTCESM